MPWLERQADMMRRKIPTFGGGWGGTSPGTLGQQQEPVQPKPQQPQTRYEGPSREQVWRAKQDAQRMQTRANYAAGARQGFGGAAANQMVGQMAGIGGGTASKTATPWKSPVNPQDAYRNTRAMYEGEAAKDLERYNAENSAWEKAYSGQLQDLEQRLASGKISQAEYDTFKNSMMGKKPAAAKTWQDYAKTGGWSIG